MLHDAARAEAGKEAKLSARRAVDRHDGSADGFGDVEQAAVVAQGDRAARETGAQLRETQLTAQVDAALAEFQELNPSGDDPTGVRVKFANLPAAHNTIQIFTYH